jgi:hypothetical protein
MKDARRCRHKGAWLLYKFSSSFGALKAICFKLSEVTIRAACVFGKASHQFISVLKQIIMKKLTNILALSILYTVLFISCKKDNPTLPSVVGYWNGKSSIDPTTYPNRGYSFLFRSDGTVRVYHLNYLTDTAAVHKGEGTYTVTANQVKTNYTILIYGIEFSTISSIDDHFTFMEGTWGPGSNPYSGGKFFISK